MEVWQDRNGSLTGQKWEAWQKINCKTPHIASLSVLFSATFDWFLPHFPGFLSFLIVFKSFVCHFCPYWQNSLAEELRTVAWQERIEFWQDGMVGPPLKMTQLRI